MQNIIHKIKNNLFLFIGLVLGVSTICVLSITIGVIHSFTSRTPLSVTQINENFAQLKAAIESTGELPIGTISAYGGINPPAGWLVCDGSVVSRTTYSNLFQVVGTRFGIGDGSSTFHLPDLRGRFLRGWDNKGEFTRDLDYNSRTAMNTNGAIGGNIGSIQEDEIKNHYHDIKIQQSNTTNGSSSSSFIFISNSQPISNEGIESTLGSESRPKNVYVNYIIRY